MSPDKLVYMANQIGKFFSTQGSDQAVAGTLAHIKAFWDPRMRATIIAHFRAGGAGLDFGDASGRRETCGVSITRPTHPGAMRHSRGSPDERRIPRSYLTYGVVCAAISGSSVVTFPDVAPASCRRRRCTAKGAHPGYRLLLTPHMKGSGPVPTPDNSCRHA